MKNGQFARTGIIGGTGLYSIEGLEVIDKKTVQTPFGPPSSQLILGRYGKNEVVFLPRHGVNHELIPSDINFRANIWAMKSLGVRRLIGVSATGSLKAEIAPGDLVIPSQYLDFTKGKRAASFFSNGLVAHISTAEPACQQLSQLMLKAARQAGVNIHSGKTYACVEGPRLGTRAESFFLRNSGCDLVGMTNIPEAFLALEAQLNYCTIAIATDYDCWMDDPSQHVTVDQVIQRYNATLSKVLDLFKVFFSMEPSDLELPVRKSLEGAVLTHKEHISAEHKRILDFLST